MPLHFAAACRARADVVRALLAAHPRAAAERGRWGRLPLALAMLCEAPPEAVQAIADAYPEALRAITISADYRNHGRGVALPVEAPPSQKGGAEP